MRTSRRLMLGASILAALIAPASATAAGPDITRVSFEDRYVDPQTCPGMALDTQLKASVAIQLFSATRAQVHQRFVYTVSANGKTFTDNESFMGVRRSHERCQQVFRNGDQHPSPRVRQHPG